MHRKMRSTYKCNDVKEIGAHLIEGAVCMRPDDNGWQHFCVQLFAVFWASEATNGKRMLRSGLGKLNPWLLPACFPIAACIAREQHILQHRTYKK